MAPAPIAELVVAWRVRAELLRPYAPTAAEAFERAADELEAAMREADSEVLNLQDAARESGYSADHLSRLLKEGKVPNVGRPHAPRIRRGDLPRKPGSPSGARADDRTSFAAVLRDASGTRARR